MSSGQVASIIILSVISLSFLILNLLFLLYYLHSDDPTPSLYPKLVSYASLLFISLIFVVIFFEIINSSPYSFKASTLNVWYALVVIQFIFVILIIPSGILVYNSFELDLYTLEYLWQFPKVSLLVYLIFAVSYFLLWLLFSLAFNNFNETIFASKYNYIKQANALDFSQSQDSLADQIQTLESTLTLILTGTNGGGDENPKNNSDWVTFGYSKIEYSKGFLSFCLVATEFMGSLIFYALFAIGSVYVPLGLISSWVYRPKAMDKKDYSRAIAEIGREAAALVSHAEPGYISSVEKSKASSLHKQNSRKDKGIKEKLLSDIDEQNRERERKKKIVLNRKMKKRAFMAEYNKLIKKFRLVNEAYALKGGNPVLYFLYLVLGVVCSLLTGFLLVVLGISIMAFNFAVMADPPVEALSSVQLSLPQYKYGNSSAKPSFSYYDSNFPFFFIDKVFMPWKFSNNILLFTLALLFVAAFLFYVELCVLSGLSHLSCIIPNFFLAFPLVKHETYANDFLINMFFLVLCSFPAVKFIVLSMLNLVGISPIAEITMWAKSDDNFMIVLWKNNVWVYEFLAVFLMALVVKIIHMGKGKDDYRFIKIQSL